MRLYEAGVSSITRAVYDGADRISEYSNSGAQTGRYVHGPVTDEPLISYGGSGLSTRNFYHADGRGRLLQSATTAALRRASSATTNTATSRRGGTGSSLPAMSTSP